MTSDRLSLVLQRRIESVPRGAGPVPTLEECAAATLLALHNPNVRGVEEEDVLPRAATRSPPEVPPVEPPSGEAAEVRIVESSVPPADVGIVSSAPPIPAPSPPTSPTDGLADLLQHLGGASRFGKEREELLAQLTNKEFEFRVAVEGTARVYSFNLPDEYRDGRAIVGTVAGSPARVKLLAAQIEQRSYGRIEAWSATRCACDVHVVGRPPLSRGVHIGGVRGSGRPLDSQSDGP